MLETDACLFEDEGFKYVVLKTPVSKCVFVRPYAEKYATDQDAFFADYSQSHVKLSELGVQWAEGGPVSI